MSVLSGPRRRKCLLSPPRGGARRENLYLSPLRCAQRQGGAFRKVELYSALIRAVAPLKRLSSLAATA